MSQTELGIIVVDEEKCNGCGDCVVECPVGAINFDEERGLPMICDLCGGSPVCVEWCPSGAVIFKSGSEKPQKGKVVSVGDGKVLDDGTLRKVQVKRGDTVLFTSYAGTEVKIDGKEYLIMSESDIMAVIEK